MKKLLSILCVAGASLVFGQANIADARTYALGSTVTVSGVALNGSELGQIRYMQDNTAGIAAYGGPITGVNRYDSITVTGPLIEFSGLLEISTVTNVVNHGPAVITPQPLLIPITSANETLESQYVQIQNVTFVQSGTFAGNTTYQVTDGTNTIDVRVNTSTNIDGTTIPSGPVTITCPLGQFNTNYQLVPRALTDITTYVAPALEINVKVNGTTVLNGGNYFVGNTASTSITIENTGAGPLTISGHSFGGTNAADFSSTITPGAVAATSSQNYNLLFTALGTGSRFATLSIASDDPDENPYIINLEAVGTDNLATQPTANPTGLTFPTVKPYKVNGSYAAGTGASKYIVLWKNGSAVTGMPVDGTSYQRGDIVGDARVAYVGNGTSFSPRGVIANQNLHFAVYAFNGQGGFENYLTTSPATGSVTSTGSNIGTYYNSINSASASLNADLEALINPHTFITYFMYKQTMMQEFEIRDTTNGQSYVKCVYSGERKVFNEPFDWTATGYSREHTFAHSWMPSFPADSPEQDEYTDQHNLYPTNLNDANTPRSNLPFGDIDGTTVYTFMDCNVGYRGTQLVFEPRDDQKGNVARSIFYMVVSYDFNLNGNINSTEQDQAMLKEWHFNDLPDNYEIARHEYIYDLQGNRNPFIDSTHYACMIDFDANGLDPNGCGGLSIDEKLQANLVVFPVPANDMIYVQVNGVEITAYQLIDATGRVVSQAKKASLPVLEMNVSNFDSGVYTILVETELGTTSKQLIIE